MPSQNFLGQNTQLVKPWDLNQIYGDGNVPLPRLNIDYFMRAPTQAQDSWTYTSVPYPDPRAPTTGRKWALTVNSTPQNIPFTIRKVA